MNLSLLSKLTNLFNAISYPVPVRRVVTKTNAGHPVLHPTHLSYGLYQRICYVSFTGIVCINLWSKSNYFFQIITVHERHFQYRHNRSHKYNIIINDTIQVLEKITINSNGYLIRFPNRPLCLMWKKRLKLIE